MNIKQKTILTCLLVAGVVAGGLYALPAAAQTECGGVDTAIIECEQSGEGDSARDSGVWGILLLAMNIMTAGVGILAVGGIVYAAILYTTSSDSAEQTKKAKDVVRNVVIGVLAYAGMYLFLNFLIPGGIFT